jgi:pimeloyl-ACP methyl ester carboxylesterase
MAQMFIPGMGLGYREWGTREYGNGLKLLLLHDLGHSGLVWRPLAKSMASTGVFCYAPDLPAHGESSACPWGYSLPAVRPVLEAFRAGMGIARPHWIAVGYSTKILLDYAAHFPDQVASMVLVDPVEPAAVPTWRRLPSYWDMQRWLQTVGPFATVTEALEAGRALMPYRLAWDGPGNGWPEPQRHAISHSFLACMQQGADGLWRSRLSPDIYQRYLEALLASDIRPDLPSATVPALIVARGKRASGAGRTLGSLLPHAETAVIQPLEDPSVRPGSFLSTLRRWVAANSWLPAPV